MKLKFSISRKLLIGFAVPLFTVIIFGILIASTVRKNAKITQDIVSISIPSVKLLSKYHWAVKESHYLLIEWIYSNQNTDTKDKKKLIELQDSVFSQITNELKAVKTNWDINEKQLSVTIENYIFDKLIPAQQEVMKKLNSVEDYGSWENIAFAENKILENGELTALTDSILDNIILLSNVIEKKSNAQITGFQNSYNDFYLIIFIGVIILIFVSLLTAFIVSRSVTVPTYKMLAVMKKISKGNILSADLEDTGDEIGQMALSVNEILAELRTTVSEIKNGANNLKSMGKSITEQTERLTTGTKNQNEAMSAMGNSLDVIAQEVDENYKHIVEAENIVSESVNKINENNVNVKTTVSALQKISERITIIRDLAFQTNILSLNASIEASRAGQFGKGFSVVAAEVGSLAERSKASSDDIDELSLANIDIAKETEVASAELVPEIQEAERLVKLVKIANQKLNQEVAKINKEIYQLNKVAYETSSFAFGMTLTTDNLNQEADKLLESIKFFKIEEDFSPKNQKENSKTEKDEIKSEKKTSETKIEQTLENKSTYSNQIPSNSKGVQINLGSIPDDDFEVF